MVFIICIPLVMILGMKSILLIVLMVPILNLSVSLFYNYKLGFEFKIRNFLISDFRMLSNFDILKNGFLINLSNIALIVVGYLTRLIIVQLGSVEDVGLFNAEYAIVASYFGMIFSAMTTNYYPNLSAISNDKVKRDKLVNENIEMSILILTPIILFFVIFIKPAIIFLYSNTFLGITDMIKFSSIGIFFKASSWSIAYLFIIQNKINHYFWNEIIANIYMLFLNFIGYKYFGLTGLGISFFFGYFLYFIQMLISSKYFLGFVFERYAVKIFLAQFCLIAAGIIVSFFDMNIYRIVVGIIIFLISLIISIKIINKHSSFKNLILAKFKR
jgi:O-antigen/teichoic acid export membrane protein